MSDKISIFLCYLHLNLINNMICICVMLIYQYLKEVRAFGGNVKQEHTLLVAVHEVGTGVGIVTFIKMLITCHIRDLHLHSHKRIVVAVRWQTYEAVKLFYLASVLRLFEEDVVVFVLFASEHNGLGFFARPQ